MADSAIESPSIGCLGTGMQSDALPVVASYVPVYCRPEMLHVHRQVTGLVRWRPHVIAQKRENNDQFPLADQSLTLLPKYPWRFFRRFWFTQCRKIPWQASAMELRAFQNAVDSCVARLVHIYFGHMALHWLPLMRVSTVPVVVSFHGADAGVDMQKPQHRAMMLEVFNLASVILARSEALLDDLAAMGCPREKLALNRTGIPTDSFPMIQRAPPANGRWLLLQSGRLIAKKGYATTLKAFAEIHKAFPNSVLRVAGDGPMKEELGAMAASLGISHAVEWLGFLKEMDMIAALATAHLYLHPSETADDGNREGVPNAMLEAMATGLPVIATRHGGIPEAIEHLSSGILIEEKDATALVREAIALLNAPEKMATMGVNARNAVVEKFSQSAAIEALEAAYFRASASSPRIERK